MIPPSTPASPPIFRIKAPRQPMLWAVLAYSSGIVAGVYQWRPALWWVVAATAFVSAALYFARRRFGLGWALALGAFFLAGALHIQARGASTHLDTSIDPFADRQELQITAHVTRDGRLQQGGFNEVKQTVDIETEQIQTATGLREAVHSGIRLSIYAPRPNDAVSEENSEASTTNSMPAFHYGDRIRASSKLKLPHNFRNPGAFDYQGYLADRGIAALGSAKIENVERLPGFAGSRIAASRSRLHRGIVAKVHELWPPREAALIDAMVIGEEAFIDRDTRVDFQRSGTYHVLVVSGMNVSILAFVVFWTLRRLRVGDIPATLLTVAFCVAYAFTTEVGAPVWRATLMCTIYLGTRLLYRDRAMLNALGAAALGLLLFDPRQLFTASFQMTFVCVLIVAAIGVPILQRTSQLQKQALANWDSNDYAATSASASRPVSCGLAVHRRARRAFRRREVVATSGPRHDSFLPGRVGIALHLRRHADGPGHAHGILLPLRHHHRTALQPDRRTLNAADDARRRSRAGPRLHFTLAGQSPRASDHVCARWNHRHRARPGRAATSRPARSHAVRNRDYLGCSCAGAGNVDGAPPRTPCSGRACRHPHSLFRSRVHPSRAARTCRSLRGHLDRRWRRRLHPPSSSSPRKDAPC